MIRYERFITREMLRTEPDTLFVFGDNLQRKGFGGQAKEMRGEPNAVGIPTKRAPTMRPEAFFTDADLDEFWHAASPKFNWLAHHVAQGGTIVLPADGLGTGRAELEKRAPLVWARLQYGLKGLHAADALHPSSTASTADPDRDGREPHANN